MLSPVCGLRPRRDSFWRMRKCPKPTIFTSSPFSKQRKMMSNNDSTTDADCRFDSPCAATALIRSFLVSAVTSSRPVESPDSPSLRRPLRDKSLVPLRRELVTGGKSARPIRVASGTHGVKHALALGCRGGAARGPDHDLQPLIGQPLGHRHRLLEAERRLHRDTPRCELPLPATLERSIHLLHAGLAHEELVLRLTLGIATAPALDRCHLDRKARVAERLGERVGVLLLLEGAQLDPVVPGRRLGGGPRAGAGLTRRVG